MYIINNDISDCSNGQLSGAPSKYGAQAIACLACPIATPLDYRYFRFEVNAPILDLNASLFTQIIRDPASSTEEVNIRVVYESLQIDFPNNVLVSQYRG